MRSRLTAQGIQGKPNHLARFLFPYSVIPRRWRSSLFQHNAGTPTRSVCSSMIAAAFASVKFPVLPVIEKGDDGTLRVIPRNTRLFTPRDFDYSPYFDIIKCPHLELTGQASYRQLPWDNEGRVCNEHGDCYVPAPHGEPALGLAVNLISNRHDKDESRIEADADGLEELGSP